MGRKKVYALFIDFSAAFDSIDRKALFYKLYNLGISTKYINIIQELYNCTESTIWNGNACSDWFQTTTGVRQGCVLSPLLFSLYLNDLHDHVGGGIMVEGTNVPLLMYADDAVFLSDSPTTLQHMIRNLEGYCKLWHLSVNLAKTKVLIFSRGGGVRARDEKWFYEGREIEIVSEYKYLGVILTSKLSFRKHVQERLLMAKSSINSTWSTFLQRKTIKASQKFKVYNAVSNAIMTYAAQVWGFSMFDEVDKLLRFFIKKLFRLPTRTPNYMIHLETGLPFASLNTLKLHYMYIAKVINHHKSGRLTKVLAKMVIEKNIFWYKEISNLADKYGISLNELSLGESLEIIWTNKCESAKAEYLEQARLSVRHDLYHKLEHNLDGDRTYFNDNNKLDLVRCMFMCRGGLLWLNANSFRTEGSALCSICNLEQDENITHFVGVCLIFRGYRVQYLGRETLSNEEVVEFLNGKNWDFLYGYCSGALKLRKVLIEEYNH